MLVMNQRKTTLGNNPKVITINDNCKKSAGALFEICKLLIFWMGDQIQKKIVPLILMMIHAKLEVFLKLEKYISLI
jgi:hypothetical protein